MTNLKHFIEYKAPDDIERIYGEKWASLDINSNCEYLISTKGRIYNMNSGKLLKGKLTEGIRIFEYTPRDKDYPLNLIGKKRNVSAKGTIRIAFSHLVADTFMKRNRLKITAVKHIDYNGLNDSVSNLEWMTEDERLVHANNSPRIRKNVTTVLTIMDVLRIKDILKLKDADKNSMSMKAIGGKFGVSEMNIYRIKSGKIWNHVNAGQIA